MYVFQVGAELCSPGMDAQASEAKLAYGEDLSPRDLEGGWNNPDSNLWAKARFRNEFFE